MMSQGKKTHQQLSLEVVTLLPKKTIHHVTSSAAPAPTNKGELEERLNMLTRIPEENYASHLTSTNYHVDRSIREATLAHHDQWLEEEETLVFTSSDRLKVYLSAQKKPLDIPVALERIRQLGDTTILTARIALGIWNVRRTNNQLCKNGSVAIRLEEILEWRGVKKHSYIANAGKRYTDGYEAKYKEQVLRDLDLLASCIVRGKVTIHFKGKRTNLNIDGPYLRYSVVTQETLWSEEAIAGVFVAPGDWINAYTEKDNYFLAEVDRKIFHFHPLRQQHELRLALYLTERWRQQAHKRNFNEPISMADLLTASMIQVDKANLTWRFAPRIGKAFEELLTQGIIGTSPICLDPVDTSRSQWGKAWLAARWIIQPPLEVQQYYETVISPPASKQLPKSKGRSKRKLEPTQ